MDQAFVRAPCGKLFGRELVTVFHAGAIGLSLGYVAGGILIEQRVEEEQPTPGNR